MSEFLTSRKKDYSLWYNELVKKAGLAENSAVRGCMVIKPYGFAIWENMQRVLDNMFKETGHSNAYFPLFIPKSYFSKEASHVEGFAKECAVVTHYRLRNSADGKGVEVDPESKLEEELIVRPTSETIIWNSYKNWIQSYRDLPLLINQWANIVRWEMRTRLFLRTAEFLWQEGHTAHETELEAREETLRMLDVYRKFAEEYLAIPVFTGKKSEGEKFAGAIDTYCIEGLMQDGKALQMGTSHFLGQNFAKAFDVKFSSRTGSLDYVWGTSWGVSTRLMGALIMAHSDDDGLVLPPKIAPIHVVIVPIYKSDEEFNNVSQAAEKILNELKTKGLLVKFDNRKDHKPGWKFSEYEMQGVPVRIALGPRDIQNGTAEVSRRDTKEKKIYTADSLGAMIPKLLDEMQKNLYQKALDWRTKNTYEVDDYGQFKKALDDTPGFMMAHWDGTAETEGKIKEETKATIRCIPVNGADESGKCMVTGNPSKGRVIFGRAY